MSVTYFKILIIGKENVGKKTFKNMSSRHIKLNALFPDINYVANSNDYFNITLEYKTLNHYVSSYSLNQYKALIILYSIDMITNIDDMKNRDFNDYIEWYNRYIIKKDIQILFICNKSDLIVNRNVDDLDDPFKALSQQYGYKHYIISAKNDRRGVVCRGILSDVLREYYMDYYPITYNEMLNGGNDDVFGNVRNKIFDGLTILISFLDLGTDLWMLYQYYTRGRRTFFIIGTIIIGVAQLVYVIAFLIKFGKSSWTLCRRISNFFMLLPMGPLLGVAFYVFAANKDGDCCCLDVFLEDCFNLDVYIKNYDNKKRSEAWRWFQEKFEKHIGFILESVFEAFPKLTYVHIYYIYTFLI